MKTSVFITMLAILAPMAVLAQEPESNSELRRELDQEVDTLSRRTRQPVAPPAVREAPRRQQVVTRPLDNAEVSTAPTVNYIIQPQAVQQQPTTIVEDTPLRESKADQMRKKRIEAEQNTEQKIVEKLETERIQSEEERASKLFNRLEGGGDRGSRTEPAQYDNADAYPQTRRAVVAAPVVADPVVVQAAPAVTTASAASDVPDEEKTRFFVGALGGVGDYPTVKNVRGIYALGVDGGVILSEHISLEGSFIYGMYDVEQVNRYPYQMMTYYPVITEMQQMNFTAGLRYQIMKTMVTPVAGALVSYTSRSYTDRQYYQSASNDITSYAFDLGLLAGVDVRIGKSFIIGSDLRYMFNLSYRTNSPYDTSFVNPQQGGTPIEKLSYYNFLITGKFIF